MGDTCNKVLLAVRMRIPTSAVVSVAIGVCPMDVKKCGRFAPKIVVGKSRCCGGLL